VKFLIVNADDFGAGSGINRGIAEAARDGILTSASLMINMPGTDDAIALSAAMPPISIGLHVNLTNESGPPLVSLDDKNACRAEILSQLESFVKRTGGLPTHLDAHHNIHRRASLLPVFAEIASCYGLPLREHSSVRYFPDFYGQWDGETHPEQIGVEHLAEMLRNEIGEGCTELSCHPGYVSPDFTSTYAEERGMELKTLCDPVMRKILRELDIQLIDYRRLREVDETARGTYS